MQDIPIPYRGINKGLPVDKVSKEYTSNMDNVRPRDVLEGRIRMGQRPGLKKYTSQIGGDAAPIVLLDTVVTIG